MVTSMERPTARETKNVWKLVAIVLGVVAIGALIWAFALQNQMRNLHAMNMSGMNMAGSSSNLGRADAEYDKRFIDAMIRHHQSAVEMAQDALGKARHDEIKRMARAIIDAQTNEINRLKQWRRDWY